MKRNGTCGPLRIGVSSTEFTEYHGTWLQPASNASRSDARWPQGLRQILSLVAATLVTLAPNLLASDNSPVQIDCEQIVKAAIGHSVALGVSDQELRIVKAKSRQTTAQGLPSLDLEARAGRYEGLEGIVLGQVVIPSVDNRYVVSASLQQPLYTGNRLSSLRQVAWLQEKAAVSARAGVKADVVLQATAAYWGWAKAVRAVRVLDVASARMAEHATDIRNRREAGVVTDNLLMATEVLLDRTRLALEQSQRQVELARARISFITGMDLTSNSVPECATTGVGADVPGEGGLLDGALKNRPERATRDMELSAAKELKRAARGAFYPQVYVTARYEQANPNVLNIPPVEEWKDDAFVGVAVSWNILDWGLTRARADEADARAAQAQLRLRQQEEQIALEVKEARIALRDALERVTLSVKAVGSAGLNLDAATDLWKNGVADHADVLDALAKLTEAEFEEASARADVTLTRAVLAHAVGRPEEESGK